jgi:glycosyltransferase involved in cell wall biosynthesis
MVDSSNNTSSVTALPPSLRIAVDGNEANVANRVGSNVYASEIIRELELITRTRPDINITVLLAQPGLPHLPIARPGWEYLVVSPPKLWTQWALPIHLFWRKADYDVLFCPGHYAPRFSSVPYINSVMDLAFLKYPDDFKKSDQLQLTSWTEYSVKRANKVVAISEFTKKEVCKTYNKLKDDVLVAYPSVSLDARPNWKQYERFMRKYKVTGPYILTVGTLQPRKNLIRLIEAFENVASEQFTNPALPTPHQKSKSIRTAFVGKKSSNQTLQLVIAGKVGWLADEILQKIAQSPHQDKIVLTGFVPDEIKQPLYQQAVCTAMVSPYEGFGIPALEAISAGGIALVANTSSLPEVVGEAGIMVNPLNVGSIANGLLQAATLSARDRTRLIRTGKQQATTFSWKKSAKYILSALESLAKP